MKKLSWYRIQPQNSCKPTQRWGHSSCVIQHCLLVFGGYADLYYMNDLWMFNTLTLEWKYIETMGNIPEPRSNATLNYYAQENKLILFGGGGQGKRRFNSVYSLDWNTKKWKQLEPQNSQNKPWQRTYHTSQIVGKYLVIFGGENFTDLNDLWVFDLKENKWEEVKIEADRLRPSSRRFHSSVIRNEELIIIGGCHGKYRSLKDVYRMDFGQFLKSNDIKSLQWKEEVIGSSDFIPRWGHSSSYNATNDKIYIFGGRFSNDLQDIIILDLDKRQSKKISVHMQECPCPRRRHSANFIGSSLIIFGGFNGNYFNDLYSIGIKVEGAAQKCEERQIIEFGRMMRQNKVGLVKIMEKNWIREFQKVYTNIRNRLGEEQADKIITSVVLGYEVESGISECMREELKEYLIEEESVWISRQQKMEQIRMKYGPNNILQEKTGEPYSFPQPLYSYENKVMNKPSQSAFYHKSQYQNLFSGLNPKKRTPYQTHPYCSTLKHQINDEIVIMQEKQFRRYVQDQEQKYQHRSTIAVRLQGKGKQRFQIKLNDKVKLMSRYFARALQERCSIDIMAQNPQDYLIYQVGLHYIQSLILVVPKTFTLEQYCKLAEFANYYCSQELTKVLERLLVNKVDYGNVSEMIMVACDNRMQVLLEKCARTILQKEEERFFQKYRTKKLTISTFQMFQSKFFSTLCHFLYPKQFQARLTHEFQINKLNILLRNIHKSNQYLCQKNKLNEQNSQKQNEEALISIR